MNTLDCRGRPLNLDRPVVMGVLNVTPDSFSDGGRFADTEPALAHARRLVDEGADLIDIGGESTRPGAADVSADEEVDRVVPIIERLAATLDVPISIDTSKPAVMRAAVAAGAGMINDVTALTTDGSVDVAAQLGVPVCLMHMQGTPRTMQSNPQYDDVVNDVLDYLADRIRACESAGLDRQQLIVDPGFGFGKTLEHNLSLLRGLERFQALGLPILAGLSRKSMLGALTGRGVEDRVSVSVAAALMAVERGAHIVRVHDVAATVDAIRLWQAVRQIGEQSAAG